MKSSELKIALKILQTTYRTEIGSALIAVFWKFFAEVPSHTFAEALESHISNPDQGRFFPTPAHILGYLVMTDQQISNDAGIEFDRDPTIDGMPSFDANRENAFQRSTRRKEYCQGQITKWHETSYEHKLAYSDTISWTQANAIRNDTKELGHE